MARLVRLMLWQTSRPVIVAIAVGTPLAVIASQQYLNFFSQRVPLGPPIFLLSAGLVLCFAWLAVSVHVIRVVRANPVKALSYE